MTGKGEKAINKTDTGKAPCCFLYIRGVTAEKNGVELVNGWKNNVIALCGSSRFMKKFMEAQKPPDY